MNGIGLKIKELREGRDLTVRELGDKIGVSGTTISNWENNNPEPSIKRLRKLAPVLGVDISYFTGNNNQVLKEPGIEYQTKANNRTTQLEIENKLLRERIEEVERQLSEAWKQVGRLSK